MSFKAQRAEWLTDTSALDEWSHSFQHHSIKEFVLKASNRAMPTEISAAANSVLPFLVMGFACIQSRAKLKKETVNEKRLTFFKLIWNNKTREEITPIPIIAKHVHWYFVICFHLLHFYGCNHWCLEWCLLVTTEIPHWYHLVFYLFKFILWLFWII